MNRNKLRTLVAASAAAGILGIAGLAYAAFFETTNAEATVASGDLAPLGVVGTPQTDYEGTQKYLWPNHPADVVIEVSNSNEVGVKVTAVTKLTVTATGTSDATCDDYIQVNPVVVEGGMPIVPANGKATLRLLDVLTLTNAAPDLCQGATFKTTWQVAGVNA
jgi:hypothetical protein